MMKKDAFPIMEYDDAPRAKLEPAAFASPPFDTDRLVITFFPEVIKKLLAAGEILPERTIDGENPVEIFRFCADPAVLLTLGQVGCPACGGNLELFHAMGIQKAMFCGGGGVLDREIAVGQVMLVDGAIRDEGFSYHYLPPSRTVSADMEVNARIAEQLEKNGVPYFRGLAWTTDALFRETPDRIEKRRAEGARIVEMEQAGCLAVAAFRGFAYGALIYGGDDLSGGEWDGRRWRSREGIRYDLVHLCRRLTAIL